MIEPPENILPRIEILLQAGETAAAKLLLAEFLRANPASVEAWRLLSQAVTDPAQKKDCLKRVLELDPLDRQALEMLEKLRPDAGQQRAAPSPDLPELAVSLPEEPISQATAETPAPKRSTRVLQPKSLPKKASKKGMWIVDLLMGLFLVTALSIGGVYFGQAQIAKSKVNQANTQAVAALLTHLPTSTATVTFTPTNTRTATFTRTDTPTPSATKTRRNTWTIQEKPAAGYTAPDFSLAEVSSGEEVTLHQFAGKPVLVVFWATWCPHCLNEMASLKDLQKKYGESGLAILAIDCGDSTASVKAYQAAHQLTFQVLLDPKKTVTQTYKASGIPAHFFIKPDGVISYVLIGEVPYGVLENQVEAIKE